MLPVCHYQLCCNRYKHEHEEAVPVEMRARVTNEGAANSRRSKTGSGADWFYHEHADDKAGSGPARNVSKEMSSNAARMKGETDRWFSHDGSDAAESSGKRSNRPASSNMQDILHQGSH